MKAEIQRCPKVRDIAHQIKSIQRCRRTLTVFHFHDYTSFLFVVFFTGLLQFIYTFFGARAVPSENQ